MTQIKMIKVDYFGVTDRSLRHGYYKWFTNIYDVLQDLISARIILPNKYVRRAHTRVTTSRYTTKTFVNSINNIYFNSFPVRKDSILHILTQNGSHYEILKFKRNNNIVTIHDTFDEYMRGNINKQIKDIISLTNLIIVPSNYTKKNLLELFYCDKEIIVINNTVNRKIFKPLKKSEIISMYNKLNLPKNTNFIIYVGTERPSKNIETLFKAFSLCKKHFINLKLIKISDTRRRKLLETFAKKLDIYKDIIWLNHVTDEELCQLYNISDALILPSISEGFGMPSIESMASGTPVIASNWAALPEVIGDSGLFFNPYDEVELCEKISKILSNEKLRENLREKGMKRAGLFEPKIAAKKILDIYSSFI